MGDAMLQNAAIDVAIALILMYLMLSLLCTVVNEFIATKLKLRARSLASALEQLLDNDALRATFYRHGLIVTTKRATAAPIPQSTLSGITSVASAAAEEVRTMLGTEQPAPATPAAGAANPNAPVATVPAPPPRENHPSYLSGRTVALALIGSLDPTKPLPGFQDVETAVKVLAPSNIRDALLASLTEANKDIDKLRTSVATWFDDSMERLSGAYKRQIKWISMFIGLFVAIAFNADSFKVATTLWIDGDRRAAAAAIAEKVAREPLPAAGQPADETAQKAIERTESSLRSLPIGWQCEAKSKWWDACVVSNWRSVNPVQILGWLLTAAAISLGAPFWFDLLNKFINMRGTGAKPERADAKKSG
jgi:hypothetical protein